ncbi:putative RNA methyltransferase [Popillia japonica]|uniref:RNA methyltransferase n=1 Tax=Popillia japonica TaxID=7064 RepID=A0AAW1MF20_POPJA
MSTSKPEKKTLKEIKAHKEKRKRWKEQEVLTKIKKQKLKEDANTVNTNEKSTIKKEYPTVSIAVPGSILENAQSVELRTYLAGQIARAACIFQVDEIVIFDDYGNEANAKTSTLEDIAGLKTVRQSCVQFGRILQYLECPQYLRKFFFPIHSDLKYAGILNPLDAPHHLRQDNTFGFREGVVTNKPVKPGKGSQVNVGLLQDVHVDKLLNPGVRCTVKLLTPEEGMKKMKGVVVSAMTPRLETGTYWGYNVRLANSISEVFSQCPYQKGYDLLIGTSDKGISVDEFECSSYKHLLIAFGGLNGLEAAVENDDVLKIDDPQLLFDHYLNTLPDQGSRTIRTEEAVLISLAALRPKIRNLGLS